MGLEAWFGGGREKLYFKVDREALAARLGGQEALESLLESSKGRLPGTGLWDGHPYLVLSPEMDAAAVRRANEAARGVDELRAVDLLLAAAIEEVGGDWSCYRRPLGQTQAQQVTQWGSLSMPARLTFLHNLNHQDLNLLVTRVMDGSFPTEAELGN